MNEAIATPQTSAQAITHKQAVKRIALWLRNSQRCAVVICERSVTYVTEQPDAIGWHSNGQSILVEVKISRSDFMADKQKSFRKFEDTGVGDLRYFAAPKGVLSPDDMPDGWGLLEITDYQIRHPAGAKPKKANKAAETSMLVSCIRRLELAGAVFVRHEPQDLDR